MRSGFRKAMVVAAVGFGMMFGSVSAQVPTPPYPCVNNGEVGEVPLQNGVRYFICWDGVWRYSYECTYDPLSGQCVIH